MNIEARKQYMDTLRERYFKASKKEKGDILNEYCRNTKQDRKHAIKKFNCKIKNKEARKPRSCFYENEVIVVLIKIWEIFDRFCGWRMEEILNTEMEKLRTLKEIFLETAG